MAKSKPRTESDSGLVITLDRAIEDLDAADFVCRFEKIQQEGGGNYSYKPLFMAPQSVMNIEQISPGQCKVMQQLTASSHMPFNIKGDAVELWSKEVFPKLLRWTVFQGATKDLGLTMGDFMRAMQGTVDSAVKRLLVSQHIAPAVKKHVDEALAREALGMEGETQ